MAPSWAMSLMVVVVVVSAAAAALTASASAGVLDTCPDKILPGMGVGGEGVTALANVSTMAECCDLCHTNYHDECVSWIFGTTPRGGGYGSHNCAIMSRLLPARPVVNHTSGIVPGAKPSPPPPSPAPAPEGPPCNADINCQLNGDFWRCKGASAPAQNASNNCHLPGPGTKGNSTCACTIQTCGATAPKTNIGKVNYLCIGDSISMGMQSDLSALLEARGWNYTHNPGNAASSNLGAHCMDDWLILNETKWDIISYNFGLHDLGYDTERISVQQYTMLMTNITKKLVAAQKQFGTKIVWVKTTPVPTVPVYDQKNCNDVTQCINPPRYDSDVVLYNTAADQVIQTAINGGANIVTNDLYSFVLKKCGGKGYAHCDGFQLPANVHYTAEGWTALANVSAQVLLETMELN